MRTGNNRQRDPLQEFEEALRQWAKRPPQQASREAARRIAAQWPPGPSSSSRWMHWPRWAAAIAALLLLWLAVGTLWRTGPEPLPPPELAANLALAPLDEDVVLIWLDAETPLYLNLSPPSAKLGEKP